MKIIYAIVLIIALSTAIGCERGTTHWESGKWLDYERSNLICNSTGLKVAQIRHEEDGWVVFGGNGALYGTYKEKLQAQREAESLITGGFSLRMGSKWLTCKVGGKG